VGENDLARRTPFAELVSDELHEGGRRGSPRTWTSWGSSDTSKPASREPKLHPQGCRAVGVADPEFARRERNRQRFGDLRCRRFMARHRDIVRRWIKMKSPDRSSNGSLPSSARPQAPPRTTQ
jgi:hypothetical protein